VTQDDDHRWRGTWGIVAVAAFWTYVLAVRPPHYDEADHVFERIGYLQAHRWVDHAMTISVVSMLVTYVAAVVHLAGAVALRATRAIPRASAALVTVGAVVMIGSTIGYVEGMAGLAGVHLRWILPAELVSAVILSIAGLQSWRIALADRARHTGPTIPEARALD
jgi:hypothetical protein